MVFYDWLSLGNTFIHVASLDGLLELLDSFLGAQILAMNSRAGPWLHIQAMLELALHPL